MRFRSGWRRLPYGYRVRFTIRGDVREPDLAWEVRWSPDVPSTCEGALRTAYRIERDAFIAEVAAKLGFRGKAATFEPDTGDVSAFEVTA